MRSIVVLPALLALTLAACHREAATAPAATDAAGADSAPLPGPEPTRGPVTGMPSRPGPGPIGAPPAASTLAIAAPADGVPAGEAPAAASTTAPAEAGIQPPPVTGVPAGTSEPTPEDAVAVVRGYFAALAAHDFARAQALWADGGASGHSAAQLAAASADVAALEALPGAPGRLDAAAGSRYLTVPVTVTRTLRDGSVQRLVGPVVLRRAVVDGATAEQRAWRIASADLRALPAP